MPIFYYKIQFYAIENNKKITIILQKFFKALLVILTIIYDRAFLFHDVPRNLHLCQVFLKAFRRTH